MKNDNKINKTYLDINIRPGVNVRPADLKDYL